VNIAWKDFISINRIKMQRLPGGNGIALLARHGDMEIMIQPVMEGASIWFVPSGDSGAIEFFFVHTGELYVEHVGEIITFEPGDSFYTQGLAQEIFMKARKDSVLLYVSSNPVFKLTSDFHEELTNLSCKSTIKIIIRSGTAETC
jgi:hypothetical protein